MGKKSKNIFSIVRGNLSGKVFLIIGFERKFYLRSLTFHLGVAILILGLGQVASQFQFNYE